MAEIQGQYRTRHPFRAFDAMLVKNPRRVEWWAHRSLAGYRNPRTELFECSPEVGKAAVLQAVDRVIDEEKRKPYTMSPRPQRGPQRWRRTRQPVSCGFIAAAIVVLATALLISFRPSLPGWLPEEVRNTAARVEALTLE